MGKRSRNKTTWRSRRSRDGAGLARSGARWIVRTFSKREAAEIAERNQEAERRNQAEDRRAAEVAQ